MKTIINSKTYNLVDESDFSISISKKERRNFCPINPCNSHKLRKGNSEGYHHRFIIKF